MDDTGPAVAYDGTLGSLLKLYRHDDLSPFQALKASTRARDYLPMLALIEETVGDRFVEELNGDDFRRWNKKWGNHGANVHRGHNAIRKLRAVLSYGTQKRFDDCRRAREILSLIRFEAPKARTVMLEYDHAVAVVEQAIKLERFSIALTQALQWDTALRRIDIIGEWLPAKAGEGGIVRGNTRWQGPSASVISSDLILTIEATSKTGSRSSHDLTLCPLTMLVLSKFDLPKIGPLIVNEKTKAPWRENYYAQAWREIAKDAGVPDHVWSMDTRAGAISETEAVSGIEAARKLATHSNAKTTLRYVRSDVLESNRATALARQKLRP
ncbi:site-specific integrase [Fulvimarina endophytica]|nr:site-specific integrase [Fulvimarina endophytica]